MPGVSLRSAPLVALLQLCLVCRSLALNPQFKSASSRSLRVLPQQTRPHYALPTKVKTNRARNRQEAALFASSPTALVQIETRDANGRRLRISSPIPNARRPSFETGLRYRSDDWLRNFLSTPKSFLLRRVRFHLATNTTFCALVVALYRRGVVSVSIPMLAHSLLGSFLGLLLVFRTNSAYSRFYEARGVWSSALSMCRGLAFDSVAYLRSHSPRSAGRFETVLAAYPDALANACLSGTIALPPHVLDAIEEDDDYASAKTRASAQHLEPAALLCLKMHAALSAAASESPSSGTDMVEALHLSSMAHDVNSLSSTLSGCEKIVQTPVPLSYSRHTSRFLTLWCGTLPFAIVQPLGIQAIPVMAIVCWLLFGIEEIGHLIEQPFVPVLAPGSVAVAAGDVQCERAARTRPYDIGLPVCTLAGQVRAEVKKITAMSA